MKPDRQEIQAKDASLLHDIKNKKIVADALREVFGDYEQSRRFIDVSRIPLICQNINVMHENIQEIKNMIRESEKKYVTVEQFAPYRKSLNIIGAAVMLGFIGALIALVWKS